MGTQSVTNRGQIAADANPLLTLIPGVGNPATAVGDKVLDVPRLMNPAGEEQAAAVGLAAILKFKKCKPALTAAEDAAKAAANKIPKKPKTLLIKSKKLVNHLKIMSVEKNSKTKKEIY